MVIADVPDLTLGCMTGGCGKVNILVYLGPAIDQSVLAERYLCNAAL